MSIMNDYEEDLDGFSTENKRKTARIYGWSISRSVDRSIYSRKWMHSEDSTSL